jgi:hypothetical protein
VIGDEALLLHLVHGLDQSALSFARPRAVSKADTFPITSCGLALSTFQRISLISLMLVRF